VTKLRRKVRREVEAAHGEQGRPLVVTLWPNGYVEVRAKGRRQGFGLPLGTIYTLACRAHVALVKERAAKMRELRRGTKAG
jgi:hypothetical protein